MVTTRRTFSLALAFVQGVSLLMGGSATATGNRVPISEAASACGASWQSVPSPSLWPNKSTFKGIAAAAPNDVWVVGSVQPPMRDAAALIEHWDGKEWSQVPAPKLYPATDLAAVVALGPHNVWVVGQWATHDMTGIGLAKIVTLILHWDGATWSVVPSPNDPASTSSSTLTGVAASGPSDI